MTKQTCKQTKSSSSVLLLLTIIPLLLKRFVTRHFFNFPGITEQNAADVNWCVNTSSSEKKIRHAARSLFHRINRTHKDVISKDEYLDAISGLTDSVRQQKLLAAAGKVNCHDLLLDSTHVLSDICCCCLGFVVCSFCICHFLFCLSFDVI